MARGKIWRCVDAEGNVMWKVPADRTKALVKAVEVVSEFRRAVTKLPEKVFLDDVTTALVRMGEAIATGDFGQPLYPNDEIPFEHDEEATIAAGAKPDE